ncbi:MAG: hypothetical protein ACREV7_11430, partial [Steroidobacteraceae bacterium]
WALASRKEPLLRQTQRGVELPRPCSLSHPARKTTGNYVLLSTSEDLDQLAAMLERKRDDTVRSAVLQLHTAIEDILNSLIVHRVLNAKSVTRKAKLRSVPGKALYRMLFGGGSIGFERKLDLAVAHRVIRASVRTKLLVLNSLRNRCSHNWILKAPVRRGRRPAQKKPPLLFYKNADLHRPSVLKDFCEEFAGVYVRLFLKL